MVRKGKQRVLVIDACVARAAGGKDTTHDTAKACRDCLTCILEICHHAALSSPLKEEWTHHQSRFARLWRKQMVDRRKLHFPPHKEDTRLREQIDELLTSDKECNAARKDVILVELANTEGKVVLSCDDEARAIFSQLAEKVPALHSVAWINPAEKDLTTWLQQGAKVNAKDRLG